MYGDKTSRRLVEKIQNLREHRADGFVFVRKNKIIFSLTKTFYEELTTTTKKAKYDIIVLLRQKIKADTTPDGEEFKDIHAIGRIIFCCFH